MALVPVTAGVLVASMLRPEGAARMSASVLSYVSPSSSEGPVGAPVTDRPAPSAIPVESAMASLKSSPAPRCELPVVSVWELPVARAEPPQSPWPVYHAPDAEPSSSSAVDIPVPRRAAKPARPRAHRSIDDLVRKVNAADSKKKY
jgi:hypothetical protein